MKFGIDDSDPFGVGALFLAQSLAHRFDCEAEVDTLLEQLLALEIPELPSVPIEVVLQPVDELLDRIEPVPGLVELVHALLRHAVATPPRTEVSQRLYRSVLWTMMRLDPDAATSDVLHILRDSTPGARHQRPDWPRHEFFSTVLVLVHLGDRAAREEVAELAEAASDLGYHDLAPVLAWYLEHDHIIERR